MWKLQWNHVKSNVKLNEIKCESCSNIEFEIKCEIECEIECEFECEIEWNQIYKTVFGYSFYMADVYHTTER